MHKAMGEVNRISEPRPVFRDLFSSLYTCKLERFVSYLHTHTKKRRHKNNLGFRKQNRFYKNIGVGEGHGGGQTSCKTSSRRR